MPNRILRDWTDSEIVDSLDVHSERFFTRLIMKVDDFGRYSANVKLLKSHLFPLKSDIRETDIARWLTACEKSGLIALYNVADKEFLQIDNFKQKLRQKVEKYPSPLICIADVVPLTSRRMLEEKRNEVEVETKEKGAAAQNFVCYDAEQELLTNQSIYEGIVSKTHFQDAAARDALHKYHLYLTEKERYPMGKQAIYAGFEKWLLNEKKFNNGSDQKRINANGTKLGTSAARVDALSKWGRTNIPAGNSSGETSH